MPSLSAAKDPRLSTCASQQESRRDSPPFSHRGRILPVCCHRLNAAVEPYVVLLFRKLKDLHSKRSKPMRRFSLNKFNMSNLADCLETQY